MILCSNTVTPHLSNMAIKYRIIISWKKKQNGKQLSHGSVIEVIEEAGVGKVPGSTGQTISDAFEDVRIAYDTEDLAQHVIESID